MSKVQEPFNPLFKDTLPKVSDSEGFAKPPEKKRAQVQKPPVADRDDFLEAMSGVKPLPEEARHRVRPLRPRSRPDYPAPDDREKGLRQLSALVRGTVELDITFSDEYIEGAVEGPPPRARGR
jgi:hypothetical protein